MPGDLSSKRRVSFTDWLMLTRIDSSGLVFCCIGYLELLSADIDKLVRIYGCIRIEFSKSCW